MKFQGQSSIGKYFKPFLLGWSWSWAGLKQYMKWGWGVNNFQFQVDFHHGFVPKYLDQSQGINMGCGINAFSKNVLGDLIFLYQGKWMRSSVWAIQSTVCWHQQGEHKFCHKCVVKHVVAAQTIIGGTCGGKACAGLLVPAKDQPGLEQTSSVQARGGPGWELGGVKQGRRRVERRADQAREGVDISRFSSHPRPDFPTQSLLDFC